MHYLNTIKSLQIKVFKKINFICKIFYIFFNCIIHSIPFVIKNFSRNGEERWGTVGNGDGRLGTVMDGEDGP